LSIEGEIEFCLDQISDDYSKLDSDARTDLERSFYLFIKAVR